MADDELRVSAGIEVGDGEDSVDVDYSGAPLSVGFNSDYVLDFLRAVTVERVELLLTDGEHAGELRPVGEDDKRSYRYVVMPMRS